MESKLNDIVKYAYTNVPFYIQMAEERNLDFNKSDLSIEWDSIPLVNKNMLLNKNSSFISAEYLKYLLQDKLLMAKTSGSTGKCLDIYWHKRDFAKSLLPLWVYRKRYFDINPDDKLCYFYTIHNLGNMEQDIEYDDNSIAFSKNGLTIERLKEIYIIILEYKPKWMLLQPSIANLIVHCIRKYNLPKIENLKYIELSSEMLSKEVREELENTFGCIIANQYGCYEANSIAFECNKGHLHCVNSNVFVEILVNGKLAKEGEEGDIYITSLNNHAMPIIRYGTGDRGAMYYDEHCECGNNNPIIELTAARSVEYIFNRDGSTINSYVFVHAVENVNYIFDNAIRQFQIVQENFTDFTVKLVLDEEFPSDLIERAFFENLVEPSLKGAVFNFEYYDVLLPDSKTGKLFYFKNNITRGE